MSEPLTPIVVDLGKTKNKRIKQLKRGEGRLVGEVQEALASIRESLGSEASTKQLVPVVVVYKKKVKGGGRLRLPFL
jgi:rRNA processing protein Krr1/Pno1